MPRAADLSSAVVVVAALVLLAREGAAAGPCRLDVYGAYSIGTRHGVDLRSRARDLHALGANFVMATGDSLSTLDALPDGMLGAPGCSLLAARDWKDMLGRWSEDAAAPRLAALAARFDRHPRVWGVCLGHEVDEYTDHDRRVWMYRLAKRFFHRTKVFFYFARTPADYGARGEVEGDVLFVAMPPYMRDGRYDPAHLRTLADEALAAIDRTPGIPLWVQTSINADQSYVRGPETMALTWGPAGERMVPHVETLVSRPSPKGACITGFFWRSFGRFEWDLGNPAFAAHREHAREIARRWLATAGAGRPTGGGTR